MSAQRHFMHHAITAPWIGAWEGIRAGAAAFFGLLAGSSAVVGTQALVQAGALFVAVVATFRRLPAAYGLTASLALLVHLASPQPGRPA